ncbi:Protein of unknown function [Bacillus wiedmannii]|nr:Protein of unknown function [Bacillus wiedmannii]
MIFSERLKREREKRN